MLTQNIHLHFVRFGFVFLWSSGFVAAKFALDYAGPFTTLFLRYALLAVILLCVAFAIFPKYKIAWKSLRQLALLGVLAHALYLSTQWAAYGLGATVGMAALVGALQPVLTGLLSLQSLDERNTQRQWLGLGIGFAAVLLIVCNKLIVGGSPIAFLLLLTSLGCITVASLHQRWWDSYLPEKQPPLLLNLTIQCAASALVLSVPAWLIEGSALYWNVEFMAALAWLSLVSLGGYGAFWYLVKRTPATQVASLVYFTVPVTMVLGYFAFGDALTVIDILGLLLAAIGVKLAMDVKAA